MTFGHSVWKKVYAKRAFVSPEWHSKSSVSVLSLSVADSREGGKHSAQSILSLSLFLERSALLQSICFFFDKFLPLSRLRRRRLRRPGSSP